MKMRDREYVSDRLYVPCDAAMEAHGRLLQCHENVYAAELMTAMQDFVDKCRDIRSRMLKEEVG